jgi:acyl carrier protein
VAIPSQEEIFDKVRESLVDALGVDDDEVTPQATLRGDRDAESIDFLDIVFRLEKAFDIKIERGELVPTDVLEDKQYAHDGKLTPAGIAELKQRMPFADLSKLESDPNIQNLGDLSVQDMCNFVEYKLKKAA